MSFQVILYTKADCKLCDEAKTDLTALKREIAHELVEVDIESDPDLQAEYGHRVPVVQAGPFTLEPPFDRRKLKMTLGAGRDSQNQRLEDQGEYYEEKLHRKNTLTGADRSIYFFAKNYLWFINILLLIYVGLPFLAPVLMKAGNTRAAQPIYSIYGAACHKLAFRSWFLFGDQAAYPREAAGVSGLSTYGEVTGFDEENLWTARAFNGNEQIGYKVSLCQRDIAIYAAMFLFGVAYALSKQRIPALAWYLWLVVGIGPIGLDGFSQLLSQFGGYFEFIPYRESTPLLRTLTGALFGLMTAWFGFPVFKETMDDTRKMLASKRARVESRASQPSD